MYVFKHFLQYLLVALKLSLTCFLGTRCIFIVALMFSTTRNSVVYDRVMVNLDHIVLMKHTFWWSIHFSVKLAVYYNSSGYTSISREYVLLRIVTFIKYTHCKYGRSKGNIPNIFLNSEAYTAELLMWSEFDLFSEW